MIKNNMPLYLASLAMGVIITLGCLFHVTNTVAAGGPGSAGNSRVDSPAAESVSVYALIANPDRYDGHRVRFRAFYAPSHGRPTFFVSKISWLIGDSDSSIVLDHIDKMFHANELARRFMYVVVEGTVRVDHKAPTRTGSQVKIRNAVMRSAYKEEGLVDVEHILKQEAKIGYTLQELDELGI